MIGLDCIQGVEDEGRRFRLSCVSKWIFNSS